MEIQCWGAASCVEREEINDTWSCTSEPRHHSRVQKGRERLRAFPERLVGELGFLPPTFPIPRGSGGEARTTQRARKDPRHWGHMGTGAGLTPVAIYLSIQPHLIGSASLEVNTEVEGLPSGKASRRRHTAHIVESMKVPPEKNCQLLSPAKSRE